MGSHVSPLGLQNFVDSVASTTGLRDYMASALHIKPSPPPRNVFLK